MARAGHSLRSRIKTSFTSRRLTRWVIINKELYDRLIRSGWIKGTRILSPLQVAIIVDFLGEP